MKTNKIARIAIVTTILNIAFLSSSANAGTRVKPPVADTEISVAWYDPILELLNI